MRVISEVKSESHGGYNASAVHGLSQSIQSFPSAIGQTIFASYADAPSIYSSAHMAYRQGSYTAETQHGKQSARSTLSSSIAYSGASSTGYFHGQETEPASRMTTPAMDWMRWSQENLNPFAQRTQAEYTTPANALMSMSDSRANTGTARGEHTEHQHQQWPLNYYSGSQYASNQPD